MIMDADTYYHRTGYCTRCDRYYGQHNEGCPLADTVPACMTTRVRCHSCGALHPAEYSHEGRFGEGAVYAVVCPVDSLTDYYTTEGLA